MPGALHLLRQRAAARPVGEGDRVTGPVVLHGVLIAQPAVGLKGRVIERGRFRVLHDEREDLGGLKQRMSE